MLDLMILPIRSKKGHGACPLAGAVLVCEMQEAVVEKESEQLVDG